MLVAAAHMGPYLDYFINNTRISKQENIIVAIDSSQFIENTYQYKQLPQINIYGENRKLIKVFAGITPIDSLLPFIQ